MRNRAQRKRRATDKAAQQKGQRKPPATKAAQQKAKRLRFGSVGVQSNLGRPPPAFGKRSSEAIQEGHRDRERRR